MGPRADRLGHASPSGVIVEKRLWLKRSNTSAKCKALAGCLLVVLVTSTFVLSMSSHISALGDLLFGQTRGRTLALLYGHSGQTFYLRQISREIDASVGAVQRELQTLSNIGLITRSVSGKQVYFKQTALILSSRS